MFRSRISVMLGLAMMLTSTLGSAATVDELQKIITMQQAQIARLSTALEDVKKQVMANTAATDQKILAAKTELQQTVSSNHDTLQTKISAVDTKSSNVNDRLSNVISGHEIVSSLRFSGPAGDAYISYDNGISITAPGGSANGYLIVHPGAIKYWRQSPERVQVIASW
ncbi:MAG TPA: hypothetical protein VE954_07300 [Oligoflexus sp.]|uniref:hypothetical protein n=1 Tax=Oligoflexus sp. TaxID=1971216 RepID=UPI002D71CC0F|nr:hypothetical protein [Oligoflexus sp.]HYX32904.1 hypothetical protein [Oligoflexus sp.]